MRALGAPAALLTMSLQGAYSAALDLRTPLIAVLGSGLLNASLDMLLIFGLGWGASTTGFTCCISPSLFQGRY